MKILKRDFYMPIQFSKKVQKRMAKHIAKYLSKRMDTMQFNLTLNRSAGDYAGKWGTPPPAECGDPLTFEQRDDGYKSSNGGVESLYWTRASADRMQSFQYGNDGERHADIVDPALEREKEIAQGDADECAKQDALDEHAYCYTNSTHAVLVGKVVDQIAPYICGEMMLQLSEFKYTRGDFIIERKDGELHLRLPLHESKCAGEDGKEESPYYRAVVFDPHGNRTSAQWNSSDLHDVIRHAINAVDEGGKFTISRLLKDGGGETEKVLGTFPHDAAVDYVLNKVQSIEHTGRREP